MNIVGTFSSFSVKDAEAAEPFYRDTLGLQTEYYKEMGILNVKLPGGADLMIYPKGDEHSPATFTVLNLMVKDVEAAVDELTDKGVVFEKYDDENVKTDAKGISSTGDGDDNSSIAWFKDPDGNILAIISDVK